MPRADTDMSAQIEQFICEMCNKTPVGPSNKTKKTSPNSDVFMEISDDSDNSQLIDNHDIFADNVIPGGSADPRYSNALKETHEQHADEIIKEAERSKARMFEIPGNVNLNLVNRQLNVNQMDEDYQMIDSHIDESIKRKILCFEYVDFCKLINRNHPYKDDDQRLEIVNHNGMTFLSPVADHEVVQISSYGKWEQAFRVFSNVLTTKYSGKAPELLQYNHTIHSASGAYIWENMYAYDKEFRRHISRHPTHSWAIILQQAWTMLLKDRLCNDNQIFQKGNFSGGGRCQNKKDREPCKHFKKGRCTFGLSCKYDHCCSVPKCGKFGHGTHVCRIRLAEQQQQQQQQVIASGAESTKKSSN